MAERTLRLRRLHLPATAARIIARAEHLRQAKERALKLVAEGAYVQAIASMQHDLGKHPGTASHPARHAGIYQSNSMSARDWIESIQ